MLGALSGGATGVSFGKDVSFAGLAGIVSLPWKVGRFFAGAGELYLERVARTLLEGGVIIFALGLLDAGLGGIVSTNFEYVARAGIRQLARLPGSSCFCASVDFLPRTDGGDKAFS